MPVRGVTYRYQERAGPGLAEEGRTHDALSLTRSEVPGRSPVSETTGHHANGSQHGLVHLNAGRRADPAAATPTRAAAPAPVADHPPAGSRPGPGRLARREQR